MLSLYENKLICENETNLNNCSFTESKNWSKISTLFYAHGLFSLVSAVFCLISVIVFVFGKDMNTRFLKFIRIFVIIHFFDSALMTIGLLGSILINEVAVNVIDKGEYLITPYLSYCLVAYTCLSSVQWAFISILELLITWERILMFVPTFTFLKKKSQLSLSLIILAYAICINMPININRQVFEQQIGSIDNRTVSIYWYGNDFDYSDNSIKKIHVWAIYISSGIRLVLPLLGEVILNLVLLIRIRIAMKNPTSQRALKQAAKNNTIFSMIVSLFSIVFNSLILAALIFQINDMRSFYVLAHAGTAVFVEVKRYVYFFLLYNLNKKFKEGLFQIFRINHLPATPNPSDDTKPARLSGLSKK